MDLVMARGCGPHGLLLTGSGDWNDGMDKVGGESQWLTWFFVHVSRRFAALLRRANSPDAALYAKAGEEYAAAAEAMLDKRLLKVLHDFQNWSHARAEG